MRTWGLDVFRAGVEAYTDKRVLEQCGSLEVAALVREAEDTIRSMEMTPREVLRVNPDRARCVILCQHPVWGRCVYKSVSVQGPVGSIHAHVNSIELTSRSVSTLFPRVHHIGRNFSIEEFIDGTTLHEISKDDWGRVDLPVFFERLWEFREPEHTGFTVGPGESAIVICRWVKKMIRAAQYAVPRVSPWPVIRLSRSARIGTLLEFTLQQAAAVQLPRGYAFNDLTPANVMLPRQLDQLYVVDVEFMKEGFFGFDCLWLLAMLTRTNCPADVIASAYTQICTDEFCRAKGADALMRSLFALLLDILGIYVGSRVRRRAIWGLRDLALADLEAAGVRPGMTTAMPSRVEAD